MGVSHGGAHGEALQEAFKVAAVVAEPVDVVGVVVGVVVAGVVAVVELDLHLVILAFGSDIALGDDADVLVAFGGNIDDSAALARRSREDAGVSGACLRGAV